MICDLRALIFSKNRTFQLKSLLESLRHYTDLKEEQISVIYKSTKPELSYRPLIQQYHCEFIEQENFYKDVFEALRDRGNSYIIFMVDDLIYRRPCLFADHVSFLDANKDVDVFSPRLGPKIVDGKLPVFTRRGRYFVWRTSPKLGVSWKYFLDLSSSMYRREHILNYLNRVKPSTITYPNPLESEYYRVIPSHFSSRKRRWLNRLLTLSRASRTMACASDPYCITVTINLTREGLNKGRPDVWTPEVLHQKMLEGYVMDFEFLEPLELTKMNLHGESFRLKLLKE